MLLAAAATHMTAAEHKLNLKVTPRFTHPLYPEQSAFFDIALENLGNETVNVAALSGNRWTPNYMVYNSAGVPQVDVRPQNLYARFGGRHGEPMPEPAQMISIPPKGEKLTWVDLWSFAAPLPKGDYYLVVRHILNQQTQETVESRHVPFSVTDAHVREAAIGYEDYSRESSLLAWLVAPGKTGPSDILVRLSVIDRHTAAQRSGATLGQTLEGSKLALSSKPPEGTPTPLGWLGVVSPGQSKDSHLTLFSINRAMSDWKSEPVTLPLTDVQPVQGFPDRDHAVFLALGQHEGGSHLIGVVMKLQGPVARAWSIPVQAKPVQSACVFHAEGPISLLLGSDDGKNSTLRRIDVDEKGSVIHAEHVVRTSPNLLLAIQPDRSAKLGFVAVEEKRDHLDQLVIVRVPVEGEVQAVDLPPAPSWPTVNGHALPPLHFQFAVAPNGRPLIAFLDADGHYYAGAADGTTLGVLPYDAKAPRIVLPHIAALGSKAYFAGFAENGSLVYVGGR